MAALVVIPEIVVVAGRTEDFNWSAFEADRRTPVAFDIDDKVRFKLAKCPDDTPLIDLLSGTPSANFSAVEIAALGDVNEDTPASGTVRLAQADTIDFRGEYHFELNLVDSSEDEPENAIKQIVRGTMRFVPSQGGDVGL